MKAEKQRRESHGTPEKTVFPYGAGHLPLAGQAAADGAIARIGYCTAVSFVLQEKRRGWYYAVTACVIPAILLPFLLYMIALKLLGHEQFSVFPDVVLFGLGGAAALIAGFGSFGVCCIPLEALCRRLLREDFPRGFELPFYPGWRFTLLFLGGFGGFAALCALGVHFL